MKILFVLENYYPHIGGVEVVFQNLAEGLTKKGHDISIITHRLKGTRRFETINKVKVYRINCLHSRYLFTFFSIPKVISLSKRSDIIHTTTFNGAPPAWIASKILKKPCIITIHEVWVNKWNKLTEMNNINSWIHNILEKMIYLLRFDRYICVSGSTKKQLDNLKIKKITSSVIYNGVDYEHWNPKKYKSDNIKKEFGINNEFIYVFTGRPGISKGLEYLIKAVPLISKSIKNSKLLAIVSKDKAYEKRYKLIKALIKKLKIENRVILHDPVSYKDLPSYIKLADCVVVPSLAEGFGFSAAEACAMEKPVVVSNTASLPEVVSGEYVLVKPKDPESIAEGIKKVYQKKTMKISLKKFLLKDNINNYLKIYREILKTDKKR
jgi:D-inositol-3-phosphate glycosyltransferase